MNEKTLHLLEFAAIRAEVAARSVSEEAAEMISGELPRLDRGEVESLKALVEAAHKLLAAFGSDNQASLPAVGCFFPKLDVEGMMLETGEVYAVGIFIERGELLRQWLSKPLPGETGETPLAKAAREIPECAEIAAGIFKIIDRDGNFRDLPALREIRKRIKSLQRDIETAGQRYAKNEDTRRMLQSEIPSQRDGRMVIAVKANFRGRIRGIVHEVSASGQTVFVEPEEVVEKNNELLIENRKLDAEMRRILRELTADIASRRDVLRSFHRGIIFLETIRARARYGFEKKGIFARCPCSASGGRESSGGKLALKQARHPLLGDAAVPLDLSMDGDIRTVIITGPNTGGKTVALKTLGLLAMMNQFALALPAAEGTILPVFSSFFADIGDEQSLSQSLSTFSAHITNIAAILSMADSRSLVLLDELGSGTDPEEGSAIAMAILDSFIEKQSRLIVTTHHGILKNYGWTQEGVENASMEFDSRTLSPTYRIIMGIPGESRAVDIAARNGLPADLVARARGYLDEERSDVSALIAGLKEKRRELDEAEQATSMEEKRLADQRREADLRELRLRQKELHLRRDGAGSLNRLLGESRKTLENLVREIKEGELTREKTLKVKEFLAGLEASVNAEEAAIKSTLEKESGEQSAARSKQHTPKGETAAALKPGQEVLAGERQRRGRILKLDKKATAGKAAQWLVEIGSLKMRFSEQELLPLPSSGKNAPPSVTLWAADLAPAAPAAFEVSLRGMRLADALQALGRQLDAAVLGGLNQFAVVHGKGDGILCNGVHEFLKNDPRVADYRFSRPELGGFGRTEVVLK
ncbi:MAG: endonuclease MutS2 [Treponema sp.]|nr:endonuclease MutS2 [Treponema sp.]